MSWAVGLVLLAEIYEERDKHDEVLPLFAKGIAALEKTQGPSHPSVAVTLSRQGRYLLKQGQLGDALRAFERSRAIWTKAFEPGHSALFESLSNMGMWHEFVGDYPAAIALYEKERALLTKLLGPVHVRLAMLYNRLGLAHKQWGNLPAARQAFDRGLAIARRVHGPSHPNTATLLVNLADLQLDLHNLAGAATLFKQARVIREKNHGRASSQLASLISRQAFIPELQNQPGKARAQYQAAWRILRDIGQTETPLAANVQLQLGRTSMHLRKIHEAQKHLQASLDLVTRIFGQQHPQVVRVLLIMAQNEQVAARPKESLVLLRRASVILQKLQLDNHPIHLNLLMTMAQNQITSGDETNGLSALRKMARNQRRQLGQMLGRLTEAEALGLLAGVHHRHQYFHSACGRVADQKEAARLGAEQLAFNKALLEETRSIQARLDAQPASQTAEVRARIRVRQARLDSALRTRGKAAPGEGEIRRLREHVATGIARLNELNARRNSEVARQLKESRQTLNDIARALPPRSCLIDFVRHGTPDNQLAIERANEKARYSVYLTFSKVDGQPPIVRRLDLGPAEPIDQAARELRRLMYAGLITAKRLDPAIQKLSKLVAQPLIDATPKARQWFICPDGALTGVPLRLLRHRGRYLVEMTAQHYLGSGRELLRLGEPSREKYTSAPLVLGAPDFNLRLKTPVNDGQKQDRFLPCQTLSALPSAANEARAVAAQWPKAKLLLGAHA